MRPEYLADLIDRFFDAASAPLVARVAALESAPAPAKGEPGERGETGDPGLDGKSVTLDDVRPLVDAAFAGVPLPKDGKDGVDGKNGIDGRSVTIDEVREHLEGEVAKWALDFERRAQDLLQRAIDRIEKPKDGRDGINGKDGMDGLAVEDFDISMEGRNLTVTVSRGDFRKSRTVRIPALLDAGVFKEGTTYEQGDGVSFGGSVWIAQVDTPQGKPGAGPDWRLAVKKGRDA